MRHCKHKGYYNPLQDGVNHSFEEDPSLDEHASSIVGAPHLRIYPLQECRQWSPETSALNQVKSRGKDSNLVFGWGQFLVILKNNTDSSLFELVSTKLWLGLQSSTDTLDASS